MYVSYCRSEYKEIKKVCSKLCVCVCVWFASVNCTGTFISFVIWTCAERPCAELWNTRYFPDTFRLLDAAKYSDDDDDDNKFPFVYSFIFSIIYI